MQARRARGADAVHIDIGYYEPGSKVHGTVLLNCPTPVFDEGLNGYIHIFTALAMSKLQVAQLHLRCWPANLTSVRMHMHKPWVTCMSL